MPRTIIDILEDKKLVISTLIFHAIKNLGLSINEFMVLVYFDNDLHKSFDLSVIGSSLHLSESEAFEAFNGLLNKKLVVIETKKDLEGRITEYVSLKNLYDLVGEEVVIKNKKEEKVDIYKVFEKEFARPISSMEYEIINAWIVNGASEEIILGALKEAIYNGVSSFRYIDKIIYEWGKKGFKTMGDVEAHLVKRREDNSKNESELFDYDWLDENNE